MGTGSGILGYGIDLKLGGTVGNNAGLIQGGRGGVYIGGAAGMVTNFGTIAATGTGGSGVVLKAGGSVDNAGGLIEGQGVDGVKIKGGVGTVTNTGTISATNLYVVSGTTMGGTGVYLGLGSVDNAGGLIEGAVNGVQIAGVGTVTNSGTIAGTAAHSFGVYLMAGGTVIDSGAISGGGGTAISFGGTGGNLLVLEHGYHLNGVVLGSASATNTLELGSTASAGTLSAALATEFVHFGTVTVDAGAQWVLSGSNTIGAGVTLSNSGTLTVAGTLTDLGTLTNTGTLTGTGSLVVDPATLINSGYIGLTVTLSGGSYLDNEATGTIAVAGNAVYGTLGAATVVNQGTILGTGTLGIGVDLVAGGSVDNTATAGLIRGYAGGVKITGGTGTVTNFGTIKSTTTTSGAGVYLGGGGTITNEAGATIVGARPGIVIIGTAATIANYGTVESTGTSTAIYSRAGGVITNAVGATIEGTTAIVFRNTVGTTVSLGSVVNSGTIEGTGTTAGSGIYFQQGGVVTNAAGATITSPRTAISFNDTLGTTVSFGSVDNSGTIESTGITTGSGIYFGQGGIVTNEAGATIVAVRNAVNIGLTAATIANYGTIKNSGTNSTIYSRGGGVITNHGVIEHGGSAANAVSITGSAGRIANYGTISATNSGTAGTIGGSGIFLGAGGTITNLGTVSASAANNGFGVDFGLGGGKIVNGTLGSTAGLITAYHIGVGFFPGTTVTPGTVTVVNYGTIQSTQTGTAGGTGFSGAGVQMGTSATGAVTNFGTISAAQTSGGWAILMQTGGTVTNSASGLITAPFQAISIQTSAGTVVNSGTISQTGTSGSTAIGLGTGTVVNFGTISSASTNGVGVSMASGGGTVTNFGLITSPNFAVSINGDTVVNSGTISAIKTSGTAFVTGIHLGAGGGTIINGTAGSTQGLITGYEVGIAVVPGTAGSTSSTTITNFGTIQSTQTGTVVQNGFTFFGWAVQIGTSATGVVSNFGTISAAQTNGGGGIQLQGGGSVTNSASGVITAPFQAINIGGSAGTVVNSGTVSQTGTAGFGAIFLGAGGTVTNSGLITTTYGLNETGVNIGSGVGTVVNSGTIHATGTNSGTGVGINSGSVNNSGLISGNSTGINAGPGVVTVSNSGTISAVKTGGTAFVTGINLSGGGTIINGTTGSAAGLITGYDVGISVFGTAVTATVVNYGTIQSTQPGTVVAGGFTFTGFGVQMFNNASGVVNNFGTISAAQTSGGGAINLGISGTVTNSGSGLIIAPFQAISISGSAGTIVNSGTISQTGTAGFGAIFVAGGTIDNLGTISSAATNGTGVSLGSGGGTVINSGLITTAYGSFETGVGAGVGATVINTGTIQAEGANSGLGVGINSGSVNNSGLISGNSTGISAGPGVVTVSNTGTISGIKTGGTAFVTGLNLSGGGTIINGTAGSTAGLITGYEAGINAFGAAGTVTVVNYGTIKSTQPGTVVANGFTFVGVGVAMGTSATGVVSNFGTISAAQTSGGDAIGMVGGGRITNSASGLITSPFQAINISGSVGTIVNSGTISQTGTTGFGAIFLGAGGTVIDSGTISAASGAAIGFGGTGSNLLVLEHGYKLVGGVFGSGTIGATNTLELAGSVGAAVAVGYSGLGLTNFQDVLFGAGGNNTLKVTNTSGTLPIKISGFTLTSDIIDLTGIGTNGTITSNDTISHTVTVTGSLGSVTLLLDASDGTSFTTAPDGTGTDLIACFCRGTLILTPSGEVPVEDLAIGDLVETISGEARPVKWIGRRAYDGRFVAGNRAVLPIRIEAGAIARFVPSSDLWLSPEHALFIDGFLVPAAQLVNHASIIQAESVERLEYFHIELDEHDIIFAEGMPAETFVDCDNRSMFQNAGEYAALYLDDERPGWQFCAQRLSAGAPELAEIRERLWARAEALGYELTDDPDPHLVIAGEIAPAQSVVGAVYRFGVAAGAEAIWLGSRSVVPAEIDAGSQDGRRLGACIERIRLYDADLCVEVGHAHYGLCDGFHEAEATHRWTNGMARLPDALLRPFAGDLTVEVHLIPGELRYPLRPPEFSSPLGVATQA